MKRVISIVLSLLLIFQFTIPCYAADEKQTGIVSVKNNNSNIITQYDAIVEDNEIYLRAMDIGTITGYSYIVSDDKTFATFEPEKISDLTSVTITFNDNKAEAMGKYYDITPIVENNEMYYPLEKMLYLLHSQWCSENNTIIVMPLTYSIIDFAQEHVVEIIESSPSQEDLLINGESQIMNSTKSVLASAIADFDERLFIPYWGAHEIMEEDYTEAIKQLAVSDESFLDINDYDNKNSILPELVYITEDFNNAMADITGQAGNIEDAINQIGKSMEQSPHFKMTEWNDISGLKIPQLEALSKEFGEIGDIL